MKYLILILLVGIFLGSCGNSNYNKENSLDTTTVEVDLNNADPETIRLNGLVENYKKTEHKRFEELNPAYKNLTTPIWTNYSKHTNNKEIQAIFNNFNIITKSKITIIIDEYISSPENYTQDSYEDMLLYLERYNGYVRQKRIKTTDLIEKLEAFKKEVEVEKIKEAIDDILNKSNNFVRNQAYTDEGKTKYKKALKKYANNGYKKDIIETRLDELEDFELDKKKYDDTKEILDISLLSKDNKLIFLNKKKKSVKVSNYYKNKMQKLINNL